MEKDKLTILTSDKVYFKTKRTTRDKEGHFTMINVDIITSLTVYAPNNAALKYTKQKLTELKREIDKSTIMFRD